MKKMLNILLIFALMFTLTGTAFAADKTKNLTDLEKNLLKKGVSLELQANMSEAMKNDIANDDSIKKLVSIEKGKSNSESNVSIDSITGLYLSTFIFTTSDISGYPAFKLYSDFYWYPTSTPTLYLTDKIAIAWNRDLSKHSQYLYYSAEDLYGNSQIYTSSQPSDYQFYGVGFDVPLNSSYGVNKSGYMWVKVYDRTVHGTVDLVTISKFYHKTIGLDGSLTFGSSPSITISSSFNYSEEQDQARYTYSTN